MSEEWLERKERLIMSESSVILLDGRDELPLRTIFLTNKRLVLSRVERRGLFRSETLYTKFPLSQIVYDDGDPRVTVTRPEGNYVLNVSFKDETVRLRFTTAQKMLARRWALAIILAATGREKEIDTKFGGSTEIADAVDDVKDGLYDIGAALGIARARSNDYTPSVASIERETIVVPAPPREKTATKAPKVTIKCAGCHAPLVGTKGSVARCAYCGTKQTL